MTRVGCLDRQVPICQNVNNRVINHDCQLDDMLKSESIISN